MKKKTLTKKTIVVALLCCLALGITAGAATAAYKTISVYTGVDIYVDGIELIQKDALGNPIDSFIYEGTTYVPLRAVSEYLGYNVKWDGTDRRVYIGEVPGETQYLLDVCPPYQTSKYSAKTTYTIMGNKYTNGFNVEDYALFNLNGKYTTLSFDIGHIDGGTMHDATVDIYLDGKLCYSIDLTSEMLLTHYDLQLNNALQMKIDGNNWYTNHYAFVNVEIS